MPEHAYTRQFLPLNLAIIEQAVWDWKQLCAKGAKNDESRAVGAAMREMRSLRKFFRSQLCAFYLNGFVSQKRLIAEMESVYVGSLLFYQVEGMNQKR